MIPVSATTVPRDSTSSITSGNLICGRRYHFRKNNYLHQGGDGCGRDVQPGKGEHLFAKVFQGGADVPDVRPVDYQEAVMALLVNMDAYRGILAVVLLQVDLQLAADSLRVDVGFHTGIALT